MVKDDEQKAIVCECKTKKHIIELYNKAKIPPLFTGAKIDSFDINIYDKEEDCKKAAQAKKIAMHFVSEYEKFVENNKGLYLYSDTKGGGKSRLAISILIALIKVKGIEGIYASEYDILNSIKATFDSNVSTQSVINRYSTVPFLVIDDFGMEKQTEFVQQTYTKIIDNRMVNKRLTVFTSNLTIDEVYKIYSNNRLPSRLNAVSLFVPMPEEDIRVKLSKKTNEFLISNILGN